MDIKKEQIIVEIKDLVNNIETFQEKVDIYCSLMKDLMLNTSGLN